MLTLGGGCVVQLWNKHQKAKVTLLRIFKDLLQEVQARGEPAEGEHSIAAHLMRTRDEKGQPIPDVRIWSELSIFFFAGVETTGHTMAWVLHLISQHPEVEAKVLAELEELQLLASPQRPSPRPIEYTDLNRLTYLSCCIKESMRLYPVVPMIFRKAMRKLRVGNFTIPKGTFFIVHIMATHTSERYWERAADFLPERWLDPNCEYARPVTPKSRYVPTGPADLFAADKPVNGKCHAQKPVNGHACAPNGISPHEPHMDVEHKASVASLLSTFKFELADEMGGAEGVQKAQTYNITLAPEKGLMMHCIPRVSSANS
ncbi:hypothetical protein WJX75_001429 [Coccomyxa subellipsoidea]|uniref:Cytochrome P450 n=1 Tax=Coccomyxa subellipsoidea TaxID=248742 RepID=A0ABR2YM85_9CHLO